MQLAITMPTVNGIDERTGMICRLLHKNIIHVINPTIATNPNILDHIIGNDHSTKCSINSVCTESLSNCALCIVHCALNKNHNNPLTTTLIAIFATLGCVKNFVIFIRAGLMLFLFLPCFRGGAEGGGVKYFVDMRSIQVRISNLKRAKRVKSLNSKHLTLNFYLSPRPISIASGFGSAPRKSRYNFIGSSVPPFSSNVRNFCAVSWSKIPFSLNNA